MEKLPLQRHEVSVGLVRASGRGICMTPDYEALLNLAVERIVFLRKELSVDNKDALALDEALVDSQPYWLDVDDGTGRNLPKDTKHYRWEGERYWEKKGSIHYKGDDK